MLEQIKSELRTLIAGNRQGDALRQLLGNHLPEGHRLHDLCSLTSGRFKTYEMERASNTMSKTALGIELANINSSILYVVDEMSEADLKQPLSTSAPAVHVPPFHAFGVDRAPQEGKFFDDQFDAMGQQVFFYYLHGDDRQQASSLADRLGYKLVGLQLTADDLTAELEVEPPLVIHCRPVLRGMREEQYRASLVHAIAQQIMGPIPMTQMRGMLDLKLTDLLDRPKLKRPDGSLHPIVCFNVTLGHSYWRKDIIPPMLRKFYESFCQSDLPASAPTFYFFFGLEYCDDKPKIREEVAAAIADRQNGDALPELEPVPREDIETWFSHHSPMIPDGYDAEQLVNDHFPPAAALDMLVVEADLKRLIEQFNEGICLKKKN